MVRAGLSWSAQADHPRFPLHKPTLNSCVACHCAPWQSPQMQPNSPDQQPRLIVHGLDLSYFTGKLEAYLRAKGIAYERREMTTASFRACGRATGVLQMPQVELPDGTWLTDTTLTIRHLEAAHPDPSLLPPEPVARFIALLIEDFGDEALWRPALCYRWAFADDARLMGSRLARGMLRDVPLPFFLRRQFITRRQQRVYLNRDGINRSTRAAVEKVYTDTLAAMEAALERHDFVMGERPTLADIGLFGSMFRHFFSDPTPAALMRERAVRTMAWVARIWAIEPAQYAGQPLIHDVPEKMSALLQLAAVIHLPELAAHADAVARGHATASFDCYGATIRVPASPYRAWCLNELKRAFQSLSPADRTRVEARLSDTAAPNILAAPIHPETYKVPRLPIEAPPAARLRGRDWNRPSA